MALLELTTIGERPVVTGPMTRPASRSEEGAGAGDAMDRVRTESPCGPETSEGVELWLRTTSRPGTS